MYGLHYNFFKKHFDTELLLLTQAVLLMKKNQKTYMQNFLSRNICLIVVAIQMIKSFLMRLIKKLLVA